MASQAAPLAALTTVPPKAPAPASSQRSRRCSSRGLKLARAIHSAASHGPPVLPSATANASAGEAPDSHDTTKEPMATAGAYTDPQRSKTASARPAAGQNGLISGDSPGTDKPISPAPT